MLFNSWEFLFGFLPAAWLLFFGAARFLGPRAALLAGVFSSCAFYAYWDPHYLILLGASVGGNFLLGEGLHLARLENAERRARVLTVVGVAFNLALLGYFKYANFAVEVASLVTGRQFNMARVLLPLAISFFTFQQISYLVDVGRGKSRRYQFLEYAFLVTFFPHLVAGPIVQHGDLLSQLSPRVFRPSSANVSLGLSFLAMGLFKKVVIADPLAPRVAEVYGHGAATPGFVAAWLATVAYTLQLYFDFSGYSDMAIGLARMFNLRFPANFNSPYKANSPIDFWRRWHMSLSRFLREYLYFGLGGNRKGPVRRQLNLFATMLLGGLWHGAGFGYVIWGGLNGVYLMVNHGFRKLMGFDGKQEPRHDFVKAQLLGLGTLLFVMLSRVFFRAVTLTDAARVFRGLSDVSHAHGAELSSQWPFVATLLGLWAFCRFAPNSQELFAAFEPVTARVQPTRLRWGLSPRHAAAVAGLALASLLSMNRVSEFLYFQF